MGRAPCCDKANVKRGPWSPEEDATLKTYVETHGTGGNWIALPRKAGLRRCGKSCRLRWLNYLRPDIKHGCFTEEEDTIICTLYNQMGSRWSAIASQLPGRTDNDVKNHWNTKLKKKLIAGKVSLKTAAETAAFPSTSTLTENAETRISDFPASQTHSGSPSPLSAITDANYWFNNNVQTQSMISFDPTQLFGQGCLNFSEIGASSVNNQQGSSISDSSSIAVEKTNSSVMTSLPEQEEVFMDFGFGFPCDLVNNSLYYHQDKVGEFEFVPSCYPGLLADNFSYPDIKPQGLNQNLI